MRLSKIMIAAIILLAPIGAPASDGAIPITVDPGYEGSPAWCGDWIAFESDRSGNNDIWMIPDTGGDATRITCTPTDEGWGMTWSPDCLEMAFIRSGYSWDLWALPAAGSCPPSHPARQITFGFDYILDPDWSPDGNTIVFDGAGIYGGGICIVPAAGGAATQLPIYIIPGAYAYYLYPCWSPDGSEIAFAGGTSDPPHGPPYGIYVVSAAGGEASLVTEANGSFLTEGIPLFPAWSPDGSRIAFSTWSGPPSHGNIWVVPATGGPAIQVTSDPADDSWPCWSPDGSQIAFQTNRSGSADIWVIDAPGPISVEKMSWAAIKAQYR
jgi:Tol biopolymer transport system component